MSFARTINMRLQIHMNSQNVNRILINALN